MRNPSINEIKMSKEPVLFVFCLFFARPFVSVLGGAREREREREREYESLTFFLWCLFAMRAEMFCDYFVKFQCCVF